MNHFSIPRKYAALSIFQKSRLETTKIVSTPPGGGYVILATPPHPSFADARNDC